jgi:hypothetical protein
MRNRRVLKTVVRLNASNTGVYGTVAQIPKRAWGTSPGSRDSREHLDR